MLNPNAQKWVDALRSGEYHRTNGCLSDCNGHCCLGVACEVALLNGVPLEKYEKYGEATTYGGHCGALPGVVRDWLGLRTGFGDFMGSSLSTLNDDGAPFPRIADIIESEPEGLFA